MSAASGGRELVLRVENEVSCELGIVLAKEMAPGLDMAPKAF